MATRVTSGKVLDAVAPHLPTLIGGSADLTGSNNTLPQGAKAIAPGDFDGSYIYFGVREHAMGGIMNGLALHGLRPYGGTFLIFSDYMRPTIRLAAMMGLPVIYIFTHDSIGLGEDGPTHQPVEHLAALRAIPNLVVIRPADGNETAQAWRVALNRKNGPTALVLTRQNLPQVSPADNGLEKGAYILKEANENKPDLILIATGSEVSLALSASEQLRDKKIDVRVVSMPSWELYDSQPEEYRYKILPDGIPKISIEAGVTLVWGHYLNARQDFAIGLDRFGASAPYQDLYQYFGITTERIVEEAQRLIKQ